jgi:CheY-like chemotaxis protein
MSDVHILLVDDDSMLCRAVERMLRPYVATMVNGAREALEALEKGTFDLILCDVMMPGMSGPELFHALGNINPSMQRRIMFMTGGMLEHVEPMMKGVPNKLIEKPFSRAELKLAVDEMLAQLSAT